MMATTFDVIENRLSHKDQTDKTTFYVFDLYSRRAICL